MSFPRFRGSLERARLLHVRLEQIAETDFGGAFLIEPFGWLAAWSVALWPDGEA